MKTKFYHILHQYVPLSAVDFCLELWESHRFNFIVTKPRLSKLGDYRYERLADKHTITVNGTLNRYAFLITYLHEVAHMHVKINYTRTVSPHGVEWKSAFRDLLVIVFEMDVFPESITKPLRKYAKNPKATTSGAVDLMKALQKYDEGPSPTLLQELVKGDEFIFNNRIFRKLEKRRTRALCLEIASNKRYLIAEVAAIEKISLDDNSAAYQSA